MLNDSYKEQAKLDRTNEWSLVRLKAIYPELCALVIFPHFEIQHVLTLVEKGYLLPAGITRFIISPSLLHINYPLNKMSANEPVEEIILELQGFPGAYREEGGALLRRGNLSV